MNNATIPVPIGINYAVRLERLIRLSGGTATARGLIEQALDRMLGRECRPRGRRGRGRGQRTRTLFERDPNCSECGKTTVMGAPSVDDQPRLTRDGKRLLCGACKRMHQFSTVCVRLSRGEPAKVESFGEGLTDAG